MTPDSLSALGIMDVSLASDNPLTRATALWEINAAKTGFMALGLFSAVIALIYSRLSGWSAYQRFLNRPDARPAVYITHLKEIFSFSFWCLLVCLCLGAFYLNRGNELISRETLFWINREDGLLETLSAVFLLVAAGLAATVCIGLRGTPMRAIRYMHGFLALLFFAMAGEEISWGQRYLGFETPENLQNLNVQNEINLHNMFGYVFDHLFILLFFLWGCVAPLLHATSRFFRQVFNLIGLPIPGAGLAICMLLITLTQEQLTAPLLGSVHTLRVAELREFLSAIAFLLLMIESKRYLIPSKEADFELNPQTR